MQNSSTARAESSIVAMAQPTNDPVRHPTLAVSLFALGVVAVLVARLRVGWTPYLDLHRRLHDLGLPDWARQLDYPLLVLAAVALGALVARRAAGIPPREALRLQRPAPTWRIMCAVASAPMLVGGAILGAARGGSLPWASIWPQCVRAPLLEELLFRSLMVGAVLAALRGTSKAFWPVAVLSSAAFALTHVAWSIDGLTSGWITLLVTGAGGLWYAWLLREWGSVLVPGLLHASMNAGWLLAGASGGAGGGGISENLLRAATIAIATGWTVRSRSRRRRAPDARPTSTA